MNVEDILDFISNPTSKEPVKLSDEDIDREIKIVELDIKREILESNRQDRGERKRFADKIFYLLLGFLVITLGTVIASGIDALSFSLSDTILITLLTTASADIIGIFIFVVKYLFKANK